MRRGTTLAEELSKYMGTLEEGTVLRGHRLWAAWERVAPAHLKEHTDNVVFKQQKKGEKNNKNLRATDTHQPRVSDTDRKLSQDTRHTTHETEPRTVLIYLNDSAQAAELNMQREYYRIMMERELATPIKEVLFFVSRKPRHRA